MSDEIKTTATWPPDYWEKARFYYFHDNDDAWGVSDRGVPLHHGMDKNDAAAAACLLNGDRNLAKSLLS